MDFRYLSLLRQAAQDPEISRSSSWAGRQTPSITGTLSKKKNGGYRIRATLQYTWKKKSSVIPSVDKITRRLRSTHPESSMGSMIHKQQGPDLETARGGGPFAVSESRCSVLGSHA